MSKFKKYCMVILMGLLTIILILIPFKVVNGFLTGDVPVAILLVVSSTVLYPCYVNLIKLLVEGWDDLL